MTALITRPGSDPGCPRRGQLGKEIQQQEVMLPNQTAFRYAKAKVAVKGQHNRAFGRIESRMAEGRFSLQDAYLWALKIHIGMMWLDARLKRERRDSSSTTILNMSHFANELVMFRHL